MNWYHSTGAGLKRGPGTLRWYNWAGIILAISPFALLFGHVCYLRCTVPVVLASLGIGLWVVLVVWLLNKE